MFITTGEINSIASDDVKILSSEEKYLDKIRNIAEKIEKNRFQKPIVLLSGPSGSGKTTTAMLIEKELDKRGVETHTISLDNYFKDFTEEERELFKKGELDLETPDRVNKELLNTQLKAIINCEEIILPRYDFVGSRSVFGDLFRRKEGEIVVVEGIHALNPNLITLPKETTEKIYISVRTRVKMGEELLHPSFIRLMRRVLRDTVQRGRSVSDTLSLYESVQRGEDKYIMPYKNLADYEFDTFCPYELAVYKEKIMALKGDDERLKIIKRFLEPINGVSCDTVPRSALIREFIGGGEFSY